MKPQTLVVTADLLRRWIPPALKSNDTLRRWVVPEEVIVARDALGAENGLPRVMVDVGAHVGSTCIPFLRSGWRVFAFEPDATNRGKLEEALARLQDPAITVESLAVSDESREAVPFYSSPVSSGISGLHVFHESHRQTGTVRTVTLDEYGATHGIDDIGLLKIDVEGFDFNVLRGVPWARLRPWAIICEFDDVKTVPLGWAFHDLCGYLQDKGYTILVSEWYPSIRYGRPHRWRRIARYPCEPLDPADCGNLIAFRKPEHAERALAECNRRAASWRLFTLLRHVTGV